MPSPRDNRASVSLPAAQQSLLVPEYENALACIRCGLCLTACPTYQLTLEEPEGPRGRIAMARALIEGHLEVTPDLVAHLSSCLLCEACTRVCPAGVQMEHLGVPLRQVIGDLTTKSWRERLLRRIVFRHLFASMSAFRQFYALLRLYRRSGLQRLAGSLGLTRLFGLAELERYLPHTLDQPLVPRDQRWPADPATEDSAALFSGCVMSTAFAETSRATVRLLTRAGYEVSLPARQGCCGALHAHCGEREAARELARRNIDAFEQGAETTIIVNAAGCGAMLKDYGHLLRDDPAYCARAANFATRVRDASEALVGRLPHHPSAAHTTVVFQDPCHLAQAQGITRQPRELLRAVGGYRVVEMAEQGLCCGSAGVYNLQFPETAERLAQRKLDHALDTGAEVIVTANPGCLLQLQAGLAARNSAVRVVHLVDLLDEVCRESDSSGGTRNQEMVATGATPRTSD